VGALLSLYDSWNTYAVAVACLERDAYLRTKYGRQVNDFRNPLEGVAGLLLLAALVLFGVIVGVSFALMFSWLNMDGTLANFLGGVVGSGLGAALAVIGAVYIQRRESRERQRGIAHAVLAHLQLVEGTANAMMAHAEALENTWPEEEEVQLGELALQLPLLRISESMGNHDSKIVGADSVD
jgi:hypothetical protein